MKAPEVLEQVLADMTRANADKRHPYRRAVLSTKGDVFPESRYVIKRDSEPNLDMLFYTDQRSPKVVQLEKYARCSLLFYEDKKRVQVRLYGKMAALTDGAQFDTHRIRALNNPMDYSTLDAPGVKANSEIVMGGTETHFCLLKFVPDRMDVLQLSRDGHTRVEYRRIGGQWAQGTFLVP